MTSPLASRTVYLIDNSPSLRGLVDALFNGIGETIHSSVSGRKALSEIPAIDPDLILCNFQTTDISGRDVFLNLVQRPFDHRLCRAPFILFSDRLTRDKLGQELFDLGLEAWFTQPLNVDGLRDVLENLFLSHDTTIRNIELRQEVRRSEYRYRDLLESVNDLVFMLDDESVFTYLNNRFTPLTGWQKESWIGRPFLDLIVETDRSKAKESIDMVSHGRARLFEAIVKNRNGTFPILSFNVSPIFEKTEITGSICIARDVTEQRTMEREILDLKNFNESIIQSMEAGLLTIDLDGFITSVNAGAENILGWRAEEILGKQIRFVLDSREADFLISNPPPPGSLPYSREGELTIRSGKQIAIGFTTTDRIDNRRQKVGTIISFRDISQLKQMQSEVMRMDRLASLGVLASGIAHEIKNPLAGIKTLAQACEEEIEPNDQRREYLMRIVRQVNRLDDLLKTFFAFARPKPPDRQPHHLQEIFQEVINLVSQRMHQSSVTYDQHFATNLPRIMVDAQQMQQVFLNLVLNAIDAMPNGGSLNVTMRRHTDPSEALIQKYQKNHPDGNIDFIEVLISDNGEGINPDKLETIFDPFFTTKSNGLGLGLSIVYRIVEEHCGEIRVNSTINEGTTFTMMLPTGA